jgi:hypothetical protein
MSRTGALTLSLLMTAAAMSPAAADPPRGFLETIHRHSILTATVPDNGDQNPYAIVVAPATAAWRSSTC